MSVAKKINSYLSAHHPDPYCDRCLASLLDLSKPQQVQQITIALGTTRDFVREHSICDICSEERKVIRRA